MDKWTIREQFFSFSVLRDSSADAVAKQLEALIKSAGVPPAKIIAFASDGASTFTGLHQGVWTRLTRSFLLPSTKFTHCLAHRLQLVMMDLQGEVPFRFEKAIFPKII